MIRFVDQAVISVQAGRGGKGCRSFYKDLWSRHPIPDGGNGGRGGHVLIRADPHQTTLLDFQSQRHFRGGPGGHGSSKGQQGFQGKDCFLSVPLGTVIWDGESGELFRELLHAGEQVQVAAGGAGGVGNAHKEKQRFPRGGKRPFIRFDTDRMEGRPGEVRKLRLELKLVADVGIVGMPNAGKSTLIGQISQAHPKIASFPFTTLHPVLGAVRLPSGEAFVAVDVPGLIEGAHQGKGLGLEFLRHIERTRLLLHLIDMAGVDDRDPLEDYRVLQGELKAYRADVAAKPTLVIANKMDHPAAKANLARFKKKVKTPIHLMSAMTGEGVQELLKQVAKKLDRIKKNG